MIQIQNDDELIIKWYLLNFYYNGILIEFLKNFLLFFKATLMMFMKRQ